MDYRMNATSETTPRRRVAHLTTLLLAALAGAASCGDPEVFLPSSQAGGPAGVIDGTVTYAGPLPCTQNQHVLGAAVLLVFDTRLLPPPEGLGTTATSLGVVAGDILFAGVRGRLVFNSDGSRWCPAASVEHVTVSTSWAVGPLEGGVFQVRGFYDLDGNFDPGFKIANLPTKGDVAGGAIDNTAAVLGGAVPVYREIALGADDGTGKRVIPATGSRVGGVTVTLGLPLPLERPVFYTKEILDETPTKNADPLDVKMPSDFQLQTFSAFDAAGTESSFIRIKLGAGVPTDEVDVAAESPFNLPVKGAPPSIFFSRQDANGDGKIDALDHIPDSEQIPSLYPISIFSKLAAGDDLNNQASPAVVIQGLTLYKSLSATAFAKTDLAAAEAEAIVAVRPAALCIDPADASKPAVLVISHDTDKAMNKIIADEAVLATAVGLQFHRTVSVVYGCLPEGRYAINLIYPTGQAWSTPNEAGICAKSEPQTADGKGCAEASGPHRVLLPSQKAVLTITPPTDAAYCVANPTPPICFAVKK
jgi:hypothetical protein